MEEKKIRRLVRGLLLAVLLLYTVPSMASGVTRCLLIGCDRFFLMPSTEPASANNTAIMEAVLTDFLPEETVITRRENEPGTVEGFETLVADTFSGADEADISLVYLSTHGILLQGGDGPRLALLLSDGTRDEALEPERLRQILDTVPGRKILILDACHSGAAIGDGSGTERNCFRDGPYRVLVSCGAEEESWFWNAEQDSYTGTGYFTSALNSALRASDPEQIDPDGSGDVNLRELTGRIREIHGASTVYCWPGNSEDPLFCLPADRKAGSLLRGLRFGEPERNGDSLVLPVRFRAEEPVRLVYQLTPRRNGRWDFEHSVRLPDREKTGLTRGLLSPGEKERSIRLTAKSLGEDGIALMQIILLEGEGRPPAVEAGRVIRLDGGNCPPGQEIPAGQ